MGSEGDFAVASKGVIAGSDPQSHAKQKQRQIAGQARNDDKRQIADQVRNDASHNSPFIKRGGSEADGVFRLSSSNKDNAVTARGKTAPIDSAHSRAMTGESNDASRNSPFPKRGGSEADGVFRLSPSNKDNAVTARGKTAPIDSARSRRMTGESNDATFARNDALRPLVIAGADPQSHANAAWSEFSFSRLDLNHQQTSQLGNTQNTALSLRAGTLIVVKNNFSVGVFVAGANNEIVEGIYNRAIVNTLEGGFYGGLFRQNSHLKFHISLGEHDYSTRRNIFLVNDYKTQAEFSAISFKAGAEATYISRLKLFDIKPFAGFRVAIVSNDEIKESNGELTNLKVAANNYKSLTGFAGVKLEKSQQDFSWYVKGELGYLFLGNNADSQYGMSFFESQTQNSMQIRGLEIEPLSFGFGAGGDFVVAKSLSLYADAQYAKNTNITYAQINVGAKLKFKISSFSHQEKAKAKPKPKSKLKETLLYENFANGKNANQADKDIEEIEAMEALENLSGTVEESVIVRVLVQEGDKNKWLKPMIISAKVFEESGTNVRLPYKVLQRVRQIMRAVRSNNQNITRIRISVYGSKTQTPQQLKIAKQRAYLIYEQMR
jgi:hypothetical protein